MQAGSSADKAILSLDGGGVRGVISIAFLERIESLLGKGSTGPVRLADHFDLIGGTSTGAIIATTLAMGFSASDVKSMYFELAPRVFRRSRFRLALVQTMFDAKALRLEIERVVGDRHLDTPDLLTSLAIVMKRLDTGGAWIVSNNPRAKYWENHPDGHYLGNRHYQLADLVRASAAAPYYFEPQEIAIAPGQPPGLFVDGGITPHNNPALALLQLATIPAYGYAWPLGLDRLRIISVGTGARRDRMNLETARRAPAAQLGIAALASMVTDSSNQVLTILHMLGRTHTPWQINSEIGDLGGFTITPEPLFTFERYDVRLDQDWLKRELEIEVGLDEVNALARMDNSEALPLAYEIGVAAAEKYVKAEHFGP
ncbi:MAG TPA: patatin-like phospholipase family protein [Bauldia sp.]|nr:patatin-like phospholipase family protein [Bauldia sp.]